MAHPHFHSFLHFHHVTQQFKSAICKAVLTCLRSYQALTDESAQTKCYEFSSCFQCFDNRFLCPKEIQDLKSLNHPDSTERCCSYHLPMDLSSYFPSSSARLLRVATKPNGIAKDPVSGMIDRTKQTMASTKHSKLQKLGKQPSKLRC